VSRVGRAFEGLFRIGGVPEDEPYGTPMSPEIERAVARSSGEREPARKPKEKNSMKWKLAAGAVALGVVVWLIGAISSAELNLPDVVPDMKVEQTDNSKALLIERLEREATFVAASSDMVHEIDVDNSTTFAGWRVPWTSSRTTWRLVGLAEARIDLSSVDMARTRAGGYVVTVPAPEVSVTVNVDATEGYKCDQQPIAEVTGGDCADVDRLMDEAAAEMKATAYSSGLLDEGEASFSEWLSGLADQFGVSRVQVLWLDGTAPASDGPASTSVTTTEVDQGR